VGSCLHRNESYVLQKAGKHLFIRKATMSFVRGILLHAFNNWRSTEGFPQRRSGLYLLVILVKFVCGWICTEARLFLTK